MQRSCSLSRSSQETNDNWPEAAIVRGFSASYVPADLSREPSAARHQVPHGLKWAAELGGTTHSIVTFIHLKQMTKTSAVFPTKLLFWIPLCY